jgi:thiol-disulfide isomerase/thioredoxin
LKFDTLRVRRDTIKEHNRYYPVRLPDMKNCRDTAYFLEFFTGWEDPPYDRETMFLVGNYKADTTYVWADLNNNLDFRDDNSFFVLTKDNPDFYIALPNQKLPEGKFLYKLGKKNYRDEEIKKSICEHFYNNDKKKGRITTDCDYWFAETRMNILSCDTVIEGSKVQIGLMDWNCNGLYNDIDTISKDNFNSDRILVGKYGSDIIPSEPSRGAVILLPETLIPINGKIYEFKEVDPAGKYLVIEKTNKTYKILEIGDTLPDLMFKTLKNDTTSLQQNIVKGKYNLIDIWGFWCSGCMMSIPTIKRLDSTYSDRLNIIGLHDYQSSKKIALETIEKKDANWTKGFLTPEIEKKLLSSGGYPYYVLVDGEGKILKFDTTLKEVEEILKNSRK